jgi:hypothetical protein
MRRLLTQTRKIVLGTSLMACATNSNIEPQPKAGPVTVRQPEPAKKTPTIPTVANEQSPTHSGPWKFSYTPGTYTYTITTAAQVTLLSDTSNKRTLQTMSKNVVVNITQNGEIVVNSLSALDSSNSCDTAAASAIMKHQLVPKLPELLVANSTLHDSANVTACISLIPSRATIKERYTVFGDTTYEGIVVLRVQRLDSTVVDGEGKIGQHRLLLTAVGTGITELYFDLTAGRLLGSTGTQVTKLDITTSGQTNHFTQYVTQHTAFLSIHKP